MFETSRPSHFYRLIKDFEVEEIEFVCESMEQCTTKKYNSMNRTDYFQVLIDVIKPNEFLNICIYLKGFTKNKINKELFNLLLKEVRNKKVHDNYKYDKKDILINNFKYDLPKNFNINKDYKKT